MSTLRVSNIEAKADGSSPSVDEKVKITNSQGAVLMQLDGKTSGITTVGINTTAPTLTVSGNNVTFAGIITAANINTTGVSTFSQLNVGTGGTIITTTSSGLVGIKTSNPSHELNVYGAISARLPSLTYVPSVTISTPGGLPGLSIFTNQASSKQYDIACDGDNFVFRREGVELSRIDSSGRVTIPNQPCFYAYQSGGATTTSTGIFNSTQWNSTLVNTGSYFNTSNGRFTTPVAGVYMFQIKALVRRMSGDGSVEISLYKNGSNIVSRSFAYTQVSGTNDHDSITALAYVSLAVNDYVQMGIFALTSGTDIYYGENLASFCGHLIG